MRNPLRTKVAGHAGIVLAVIALAVGPAGAYMVERDTHDELTVLDTNGTTAAVDRIEELDAELDRLEARLTTIEARLADHDHRLMTVEDRVALAELAIADLADRPNPAAAAQVSTKAVTGAGVVELNTEDRWDALAACESTGDTDGVAPHRVDLDPDGYFLTSFQFDPSAGGTAEKVGAYRGMPYDAAKAAAQAWAARDDVDASTSMGWPTCWPLVMGGTPR